MSLDFFPDVGKNRKFIGGETNDDYEHATVRIDNIPGGGLISDPGTSILRHEE